ncbi:MAG: hypothetical protein ACSHX8_01360 [Opitutaceae bacterium]
MDLKKRKAYNFLKRPIAIGFVAVGLFCACMSTMVSAQRAGGDEPSRFMERIDQAEGARRMASFRSQRLAGDYCFRFELEHLPRRGKKTTHHGVMWGSWNELGPVTRIQLLTSGNDSAETNEGTIELIIQNGLEPKVWSRTRVGDKFQKVEGDALFEPIITSVVYAAFDLQMPFIYWDEFVYEGPGRVQSRVAQQFLMMPPEGSAALDRGIQSVRIGLDDAYDALLRVEVLGDADEELSRFTVESFKKVQEQYIVKEVALKNYTTKDRTRFKVKSASVGLVLDKNIFSACHSIIPEVIPDALFEEL